MKTFVENLNRLKHLTAEEKATIERKASAHRRFSNIGFCVMACNDTEIIVQVAQLKHLSENYATAEKLREIGESVFVPVAYGRTVKIGAKPYVPAPADMVTIQWIKDKMSQQRLKAVDLEILLGIDKSSISLYLNGKRELTRSIKSMFYYFFMYNEIQTSVKDGNDL